MKLINVMKGLAQGLALKQRPKATLKMHGLLASENAQGIKLVL